MTIWDIYPAPIAWLMVIFAWVISHWRIIVGAILVIILVVYLHRKKKKEKENV